MTEPDDMQLSYIPPASLVRGLGYGLPASLLLWVLIIQAVRGLL